MSVIKGIQLYLLSQQVCKILSSLVVMPIANSKHPFLLL